MSQCVPNWDVDDNPTPLKINALPQSVSNSLGTDVPSLDYEVAELTWENGQLAMHGLGQPRVTTNKYTWDKPRAGGTLESIVSQATHRKHDVTAAATATGGELVPWFNWDPHPTATVSVTMTMDALVPCAATATHAPKQRPTRVAGLSGIAGSCSGVARVGGGGSAGGEWSNSVSGSATYGRDREVCTTEGFTSTSPENTVSDKLCTNNKSNDDNDHSVCHSRSQREIGTDEEEQKKKGNRKSSISTKRSRAAAIHNQSERKRRDKINQRMKTLQKLVPNSSKTDKASMLDEVIEYLKQLQAQVQMMSRMNMSPMMFQSLAMQQQLQMSMMGMNMGMGMGHVMDHMNSIHATGGGRTNLAGIPPFLNPNAAAAFIPPMAWWENFAADRMPAAAAMPPDPLAAFLAPQSQPMSNVDAYTRMAALYQQFQQQASGGSKN